MHFKVIFRHPAGALLSMCHRVQNYKEAEAQTLRTWPGATIIESFIEIDPIAGPG
jgi:hypothetical protein